MNLQKEDIKRAVSELDNAEPNGTGGASPAVTAQGVSFAGILQKTGCPHTTLTSASEDSSALYSELRCQGMEFSLPCPLKLNDSEACILCLNSFQSAPMRSLFSLMLSVCLIGGFYPPITFLCPFQYSL